MKRFFFGPVREGWYHVYYLLGALSACAYGSFLNVYLGYLGYGAMVIGLFSTIPSLIGTVLQPFVAAMTDRSRHKLRAMLVLVALATAAMGLMLVVRPRGEADDLTAGAMMGVQTLYLVFSGAATSLNTAIIMDHLTQQGVPGYYGRIRVSWTVGYAIAGAWVGRISKVTPTGFIPYAVVMNILSALVLPLLVWPKEETRHEKEKANRLELKALLGYKELWALLAITFLISVANAFTYTHLPTFFMTLPGADNEVFGWCISLRTVTEVPLLFAMGWLLSRLGIKMTIMIPAVTTVLRWLLVALFPATTMVLVTQLLHGFGYVVYSVAMIRYVSDTLPKEIGTTAQNAVALLTTTVPNLVGGLFGGLIIETWGLGYMACLWSVVGLAVLSTVALAVLAIRMPDTRKTVPQK